MSLFRWPLGPMLCSLLAAGCAADPSSTPDASPGEDDTDTSPGDTDTGDASAPIDSGAGADAGPPGGALQGLVGLYAERTVIVTTSSPVGPTEYTTEAHYYGLARIALVDGGLVVTSTSCHSDLQTTSPVHASMDDAVVRSLPPFVGALAVSEVGGVLHVAREELVMPLGVHLEDPWNEALPTETTDPRVWDQDSDGNPGISVDLTGLMSATIYAVRRERGWWEASVVGADRLSGLVHDSSEQSVIGATNPLFDQNVEETMDPDPSKHTFDLARLDGDWDCDRLVSELGAVFPE
jgi:hypothetical protein